MTARRFDLTAVGDTLQLWIALGIATMTWAPVYRTPDLLVLAAVAVPLGTAIAFVGALWRWPGWAVLLTTFGAFTIVGVPLAVPTETIGGVIPTLDGLADLYAGVALGWKQLLTISLPVGDYQALLVPVLVLLLGASVLSGSIMYRARYGEFAAIPPVVVFITGLAFGSNEVDDAVAIALGFGMLVVSVSWASWWRWRRRRAATRGFARAAGQAGMRLGAEARALIGALLALEIAAIGAVAVTANYGPGGDRVVLRDSVEQPFDPRDQVSPLSSFRSYLQPERVDETMMRVTGLSGDSLIRIATLDSYDGVVYTVGSASVDSASGVFVRLPSAIDRSDEPGTPIELEVAIDAYSGVWLPTVGALEDIVFTAGGAQRLQDGFVFNHESGTAVDLAGLSAGDGYRLRTLERAPSTFEALRDAVPGSASVPRMAEPPEELLTALDEWTVGIEGAGARLVAALDAMRAEGYISHGVDPDEPASRSGHSLDRITELFTSPQMIGDAEQYAVAAALMADRLGFPVRVVVGFAPEPAGEAATTEVVGGDITAWIEVDTAREGWVAIDPVPPVRPIPDEVPEEPAPVSRPESIVPPPADRPDPREEQSDPDTTAEEPSVPDATLEILLRALAIIGGTIGIIALLLAPFLIVIGAKARRRHLRRTADTTLGRIRGGWDEFSDLVVDHGLTTPASATRSEYAAVIGTLPARVLAAVVDRAVFAPGEPGVQDADRVWVAVDELRGSLDAGRTRRERLRARVSLRSLGGAGVRGLLRRPGVRA